MTETYPNLILIIVFTFVGLAFALGFVMIAVWAVRNGQFKDIEGVKYRMMEDIFDKRKDPKPTPVKQKDEF